jgi:hypothetical protein
MHGAAQGPYRPNLRWRWWVSRKARRRWGPLPPEPALAVVGVAQGAAAQGPYRPNLRWRWW